MGNRQLPIAIFQTTRNYQPLDANTPPQTSCCQTVIINPHVLTANRKSVTSNRQPPTIIQQPPYEIAYRQSATFNRQPANDKFQQTCTNQQEQIGNRQSITSTW